MCKGVSATVEGTACRGGTPWGVGGCCRGGEPRAGRGPPPWRAPRVGGCTTAMEGTPGTALSCTLWAICCTNWMRVLTVLP